MFVKVEPSGCCERKGMVQVRFCMYLDSTDYGYEKYHVEMPVIPEGGYPGKVDDMGMPINQKDYDRWIKSLPKVWQNNPFHNHFIQAEPETTDKEIMDIASTFLREGGIRWATDNKLDLVNDALPFKKPEVVDATRIKDCEVRVQSVKAITTEIRV